MSRPATKLADSEADSRFASMAVNDWEPKTGLVDTAESCPDPKQYRCYLSHNLNKAVKHGISTGS